MKILYDHQIFTSQKIGGISRYFTEIMKQINLVNDIKFELPLKYSNNLYLKSIDFKRKIKKKKDYKSFLKSLKFKGKKRLFDYIYPDYYAHNKKESIIFLKKQNFDIFHPTNYDPYFLEFIGRKPFVLTIHDMIHEKFPEYYNSWDKTAINKKKLTEKAAMIIAVSEQTKNDLIDIYGLDSQKIKVIYHGNSMLENGLKPNLEMPQKYILYVGCRKRYKNFNVLLDAFSKLSTVFHDLYFVCVGSMFNDIEKKVIKTLNISNKVVNIIPSDEELCWIYSNAEAFIFPSLYEGFGIPILEAFSAKCPVLLSDINIFREIAKSSAVFFDPYNSNSIVEAVTYLLSNRDVKKKIIESGYKRLKMFSWKHAANETINLYRNVMSNEISQNYNCDSIL